MIEGTRSKDVIRKILVLCLFAIMASILFIPLVSNLFIQDIVDVINHLAIIVQANFALKDGQFPLRIAPLEQAGWGYPYFQFYSPTLYTIAAFFYRLLSPANPYIAYKITIWLSLVIGAFYFYQAARKLFHTEQSALLATTAYLFSPYYTITIIHMGAFAEAVALGMIPVVLFYNLSLYQQFKWTTFLITGIAWFLLITTHLVTFVYATIFMSMMFLLATVYGVRSCKYLFECLLAFLFGCVLSLWYLAPVLLIGKYTMVTTTFAYFLHPALITLLVPYVSMLTGSASTILRIHPTFGLPITFAFLMSIYLTFKKFRIFARSGNWSTPIFITFIISFIYVWNPIDLYSWLPEPLKIGQYNWRLLAQSSWLGALLFGWVINCIFPKELNYKQILIGILLIIIPSLVWFNTKEINMISYQKYLQTPYLIFNPQAYTLNYITYPNVNGIDHLLVTAALNLSSTGGYLLRLNEPLHFSLAKTIKTPTSPYLSITAQIPQNSHLINEKITALLNTKTISTAQLKAGNFYWNIPLDSVLKSNQIQAFDLEFKSKPNLVLPVKQVILTGFLNPRKVITATQLMPDCKRKNVQTICDVNVPNEVRIIELPVLYYPNMLKVILNGKVVPYISMIYRSALIPAILAAPGQHNHIVVEFQGLEWANYMTAVAWWLVLIFIVYYCLREIQIWLGWRK